MMLTKNYSSMINQYGFLNSLKLLDDLYLTSVSHEPRYVVESSENGLELSIDLPGIKFEDLDVIVSGKTLQVSGKRRGTPFRHSYSISKEYNPDPTDAILSDGVLNLKFDRAEDVKTRQIKIRSK